MRAVGEFLLSNGLLGALITVKYKGLSYSKFRGD
jgi:hypothetical protein